MGIETFELTKSWFQWAGKTSKKIKSTKLCKAIDDYADLAFKPYQFRGLKWYDEALESLTKVQSTVDDVSEELETDKDVNTQLVLAALDKGKNVVRDEKTEITKDQKEYKTGVQKQKETADKLEKAMHKLSTDSHKLLIQAGKLRERLKESQKAPEQLQIVQKGAQFLKDESQKLVDPIKLLKDRFSIEANSAKNSTVTDDRALFWFTPEKSFLADEEGYIKNTIKIADEILSATPDRPKTPAPPLPKKFQ